SNGQVTAFLPIWYIYQALGQIGVKASWDGTKGVLNLTTPSGMTVNDPSAVKTVPITSSTMVIEINGKPVTYAPRIAYLDEGSRDVVTTFVPVYYLQQALSYLGVQTSWNGTEWNMTVSSSTNGSGQSSSGGAASAPVYETQQQMADAMWQLFNSLPMFNPNHPMVGHVIAHPTMAQVGVTITNPNGQVTAGQVATWLADWAAIAMPMDYNAISGTTSPAGSMQTFLSFQSSNDPFTWASQNDLFQGTGIANSNTALTTTQAQTVWSNLQWWLYGYKEQNGVYTLHAPLAIYGIGKPQGYSEQVFQEDMSEATYFFDRIKVWGDGETIHVELPNATGTNVIYAVVDPKPDGMTWGYGYFNGWDVPLQGGTTLTFQNAGAGFGISVVGADIPKHVLVGGYSVDYGSGLPNNSFDYLG
ncbi:MAG: copper amine oxidase N-terminal domain-containing protein, partial [Alicyclobacillus sp.]|nr:copper amine oxidase N-terminal domain-containing protein [Alicyclobacillus sp.]